MKRLSDFQIILVTFLILILFGTVMLSLSVAHAGDHPELIDILFTSTSAVCVTGLVPLDTATTWNHFGHAVLLLLIQLGGLGLVTVLLLLNIMSGKTIGLSTRNLAKQSVSALQLGGIIRLTLFAVQCTFVVELIGAILLMFAFIPQFGVQLGAFYALFHSISAFCNAGFDLMGVVSPFSSLTSLSGSVIINTVIPTLIVIGGIGFLCLQDIYDHKFNFKQYHLQTKIVLTMAAILIGGGFLYFYFFEFMNWTDLTTDEKIMASIFTSVTPRTAGFNTVDLNRISDSGQLLIIILMLIGAAPGSTGGGMKVTTFFVFLVAASSVIKDRTEISAFERKIPTDTMKQAVTILTSYLILLIVGTMVISKVEQLPLMACMFETASALGTVGLTLGITPSLHTVSKIILITFMIFGRVGSLTFLHATIVRVKKSYARYPQEPFNVG